MKNKSLMACFLAIGFLSSCSTTNKLEMRKVASKEYECTFDDVIDGEKTSFIFSPDSLKLTVTNSKFGAETLFLSEDDFVSGGFTFVSDAALDKSHYSLKKLEFISFTQTPSVTLNFSRTPASNKAKIVKKTCN